MSPPKDVLKAGISLPDESDESVRLLAHGTEIHVRLAKVPQSLVDQMSPADLNAAAWLVAVFFLRAPDG